MAGFCDHSAIVGVKMVTRSVSSVPEVPSIYAKLNFQMAEKKLSEITKKVSGLVVTMKFCL